MQWRIDRVGLAVAALVVTTGLISVGSVQGAGATTHPTYPLGHAKSCKTNYVKRTERRVVKGGEQRYVACVYAPGLTRPVTTTTTTTAASHPTGSGYRLAVSISDLDSHGEYHTGDRVVVTVTAYKGAQPVTTGAYDVNTIAPTENSGLCGIVIENPKLPTGYCELIFSQSGDFKVTESYGYGSYANLAQASQEVTIYSGGL